MTAKESENSSDEKIKIFSSNDENSLESRLKAELEIEEDADDRPTEEVAFYYNKIRAHALQTISNILR